MIEWISKSDKETCLRLLCISLPFLILSVCVVLYSDGSLTYTLDDPYIHLALAKNIWMGNYGINLTEPSAPSSSILWPYLLAPFSVFPSVFEYVPLIFNMMCVIGSGYILTEIFSSLNKVVSLFLSVVILISFNIYGLAFTGMEHSFQILLVLVIAYGLVTKKSLIENRPFRLAFYSCLVVLPLVRYEGLAISVPVLIYMIAAGEKKIAFISFCALCTFLMSFSLYLYSKGLGFLPSSIVAKVAYSKFDAIVDNLKANINQHGMLIPIVLFYCWYTWRSNKALGLVLVGVTALHFLFGKYGWFCRYEVYYCIFIMVLICRSMVETMPKSWVLVIVLPFLFPTLSLATFATPLASSNIYNQHANMAKIVQLLDDNVAVNDLGLVALRSDNYVLDLWGLGSVEALMNRRRAGGTLWMSTLMRKKNVSYAMIYDEWFPEKPENWAKVAELKLLEKRITPACDVVSFYATSAESVRRLKKVLKGFKGQHQSPKYSIVFHPALVD